MPRPKKGERRDIEVKFRVTSQELELLKEASRLVKSPVAVWCRKRALGDTPVISTDREALEGLELQLARIGANLNQLAKRANEGRFPLEFDLNEVLEEVRETAAAIREKIG